jgi:hypothetical protein
MRTCSLDADNDFAKMCPEAMCRWAACASSKGHILSITGLMPVAAIARLIASNICIEQRPHHIWQAGSRGGPPALPT